MNTFRLITILSFISIFQSTLQAQVPPLINYQGRVAVNNTNFHGTGDFKFALVDGGVDVSETATATATVSGGFLTIITVDSGGAGYVTPPVVMITDSNGSGASATAFINSGSVTGIAVDVPGSGYTPTPTVTLTAPPPSFSYVTYWSNDGSSTTGDEPVQDVSLNVVKGLYSLLLGDVSISNMTPIAGTAFTNDDVRLRVWFNDGVSGFQQLSPDQRVASVGYSLNSDAALTAQTAQSVVAGGITESMIATGAVTSATIADGAVGSMDIGSNAVTTTSLADGAVTAVKVSHIADTTFSLRAAIPNPTPVAGDTFGFSVSGVGSNHFVVGAFDDDTGATDAGSAYLYDLSGTLLATITNPAPEVDDRFGISVSGVGSNRFLVGCPFDDAGTTNAGSVYIYDLSGTLLVTITNPTPSVFEEFGKSVSGIGPDHFVVGTPSDSTVAFVAGIAYLYDLSGTLLATITNSALMPEDHFGESVSGVGSNHFVVGAPSQDSGALSAGSVYIYDLSGTLLVTITNPSPEVSDNFGSSISGVGSNRFVVAARGDNTGATNSGSVYMYDLSGTLLATITNPAPAVDDRFGQSVSGVGPDRFVVGASSDDAGAPFAGSLYLYDLNGVLIDSFHSPSPEPGDGLGISVAAIGAHNFVAGADGDDPEGFNNAGSAYIYSIGQHADDLIAEGVQPRSITAGMLARDIGIWHKSGGDISYTEGNVGIGTANPTNTLHVVGTVQATAYITGSDMKTKENISPVSPEDILAKVSLLPIATWNFKTGDSGTHLGPMAQDFHAAFNLGNTDSGIFTVDADGVSLAAIQGLNEKLEEQNRDLQQQIDELKDQINHMQEELEAGAP